MSPLHKGASRGLFLLPLPRLELLPPTPALGLAAQLSRDRPADTAPLPLPDTAAATSTGRAGPPRPPDPAAWGAPPDADAATAATAAAAEGGDGEEDKDEEAEVTEEAAEEPGLVPAEPDPAWRLPDIVTPPPPAGRSERVRDRDPPPPPSPQPQCILRPRRAGRWGGGTIKLIFFYGEQTAASDKRGRRKLRKPRNHYRCRGRHRRGPRRSQPGRAEGRPCAHASGGRGGSGGGDNFAGRSDARSAPPVAA